MRPTCILLCAAACSAHSHGAVPDVDASLPALDGSGDASTTGGHWQPAVGATWQLQLQGTIDTAVDAAVFDIDLIDVPPAVIDDLHAKGRRVICYFDTAYEPNRPESAQLAPYRGDPIAGWPGQYWLDIRVPAVRDVMVNRIEMARTKHCDGIDPDDVDVTSNDTKLHITPAEQLDFIQLLGREAHARGLATGLKNDLDQVAVLAGELDFSVNEECFKYTECDQLAPWIAAGKPVFHVEYTTGDLAAFGHTICPKAHALSFSTDIKHLDLDAPRYGC